MGHGISQESSQDSRPRHTRIRLPEKVVSNMNHETRLIKSVSVIVGFLRLRELQPEFRSINLVMARPRFRVRVEAIYPRLIHVNNYNIAQKKSYI